MIIRYQIKHMYAIKISFTNVYFGSPGKNYGAVYDPIYINFKFIQNTFLS